MGLMGRRASKPKPADELAPWLKALLLDGTKPERDTPAWSEYVTAYYLSGPHAMAKLWRRHREAVRAEAQALGVEPYGEMFEDDPGEAA